MSITKEMIEKFPFWNNLTDNEKSFVTQNTLIREFNKGSNLMCSKDVCIGTMYILSGQIRIYILSEEGREITLFSLCEGESCVISASCVIEQITFEAYIEAERDTHIMMLNSSDFSKLVENNIYVKCYMYKLLTERFSTVMWTMQQVLFNKMDKRIASFLILEYEKTGNREILLTQEQIAVNINSAREVVSRMLKRFETEGLVSLKRGRIVLLDIQALKNI